MALEWQQHFVFTVTASLLTAYIQIIGMAVKTGITSQQHEWENDQQKRN